MVNPMPGSGGRYQRSTEVALGYYPNVAGTQSVWSGTDTSSGLIAELLMDRDREVNVTVDRQ